MCGIVGVITKQKNGFTQSEITMVSQLLYADALRGSDGTGIFFNTKKNKPNVKIIKQAASAGWFLFQKDYQKAKDTFFSDSNFVIGHNRSATKGKINQECTHPFREQHITLVHNGTLSSHDKLNKDSEVDSHAICVSMATKGEEETLKEIDGAFALVWFNAKTKKLNICRNSQRPLYLIETHQNFLISSELELAQWILKRNNQTIKSTEEIKIKTLYSFNLDDMSKFQTKDIEFKSWVYSGPNYQHDSDWYQDCGTGKGYSAYVNTRALKVGDKIKFKTSQIRRNNKGEPFVEGDILRWQQLGASTAMLASDFRDEWDIRIVGTEQDLLPIAMETKIEGVIVQIITTQGNKKLFVVENAIKYGENYQGKENVLTLPLIKKETTPPNEKECEWCGLERTGTKEYAGQLVCDGCWETNVNLVQYMS